jgi:hypothetical protein
MGLEVVIDKCIICDMERDLSTNTWIKTVFVNTLLPLRVNNSLCPSCKIKIRSLLGISEEVRYAVFYNEIGVDYGDSGERVFNTVDIELANEIYDKIKDKCEFIQMWDRREQTVLKQKGI